MCGHSIVCPLGGTVSVSAVWYIPQVDFHLNHAMPTDVHSTGTGIPQERITNLYSAKEGRLLEAIVIDGNVVMLYYYYSMQCRVDMK